MILWSDFVTHIVTLPLLHTEIRLRVMPDLHLQTLLYLILKYFPGKNIPGQRFDITYLLRSTGTINSQM